MFRKRLSGHSFRTQRFKSKPRRRRFRKLVDATREPRRRLSAELLEDRRLLTFDIVVNFLPPDGGADFTAAEMALFTTAEQKWESLVTGITGANGPNLTLNISAQVSAPAFPNGAADPLGRGGPGTFPLMPFPNPDFFPTNGTMVFNPANFPGQTMTEQTNTILHEMGHVLGIGTLFCMRDLLVDATTGNRCTGANTEPPSPTDLQFTGTNATAEYNALYGLSKTTTPMENDGAHWRESVFFNELMTPTQDPGLVNPNSRMTVAALQDLGYVVNIANADAFTLPFDFGDAPDFGFTPSSYPTLLNNNGARHQVAANTLILGSVFDVEGDGQPDGEAGAVQFGDDNNPTGAPDDEDGVALGILVQGQIASVTVTTSVNQPMAGMPVPTTVLNAWVDFNADGIWAPGEQIFMNQPVTNGTNMLTFLVPAGTTLVPPNWFFVGSAANTSYARFRISTVQAVLPTGMVSDGEVEDYIVQIQPPLGSIYTIAKTVTDVGGDGAGGSVDAAGDVITYSIVVTNTGGQSINGVVLSDPLLQGANGTLSAAVESGAADGVLSFGETFTYTGTYTAQQSDIDDNGGGDGDIDNTATVTSTQLPLPLSDSAAVPIVQLSYAITKTVTDVGGDGAGGSVDAAGDVIMYSIVVTNTGGQNINGVVLSDPLLEDANGTLSAAVESGAADGILSVGETFTYTGTYTAQQSDIDDNGGGDGDIDNTATVISTEITTPQSDTAAVPIVQLLSYAIAKTVTDVGGDGAGGSVDAAGDVITYSIVVTNTGGQSINGVVLSDPLLQGANGTLSAAVESGAADGILSVGETFTYTGTYTAQQSDIDDNGGGDGDIDNTATVTSTEITTPQSDTAAVPIVQLLSYAITKTVTDVDGGGAGGAVDAAGDVIMYSIVVTNTGGQNINGVVLSDPLLQGANGTLSAAVESGAADGILSVGETFTYTGTYTAQQSDIDDNGGGDGDIDNTATVTSTEITTPQSDTAAVPIVQLLSYAITKTVTDVDGGGAGGAVDAAGDVIMYSIVVTNTGGQNINGVVLSDPLLQGANGTLSAAVESGAADGILSVGETFTYTGTYTAQQSDIDDNGGGDGDIDNTATVTSTEITTPQSDTAAVPIVQLLSYAITKTVTDVDGGGAGGAVDAAGDVIMYSIVVTNTGGQNINGVVLSDPLLQGANGTLSAAVESGAADGILSVGETFTYTGTYTAQQSDIDDNGGGDGDIDNTATVTSTEITTPQSDTAAVPIVQLLSYAITKTVTDVDGGGAGGAVDAAGDVIMYSIVVTNTGGQSINGVVLSDPLLQGANGTLSAAVESGAADGILSVGETFTYTGTYTAQQSDIDDNGGGDGDIDNTATVTSTEITTPQSDTAAVPIVQLLSYAITKTVTDVDGGGAGGAVDAAGDVIMYSIVVTNTGGQNINGVVLSDPLLQGANGTLSAAVESGAADGILSVGETFTYTGTYTAQQSDIDDNGGGDGDIDNTATVTSTEITTPQSDTAAVPIVQLLSYAITKTVTDVDGGGAGGAVDAAGDVIMYSIVVTNTGGQSINGVVLSDPLLQGANGTLSAAVESGAADGILSVAETFTYTGTYTAQQSDIDDNGGGDGDIDNTATVISTEIPEPQSDTAAVPIVQLLSYAITKTVTDVDGGGAGGAVDAAGDVIMYSIVVTNTGGQSINGVVLSDPLLQGANGTLSAAVESGAADGILSVGETFTYTGTYTAQQSDIDDNGGGDGDIDNTATVISTEIPEPQSDTAAVPIVQLLSYAITKTVTDVDGGGAGGAVDAAGDVIMYSIVVTNTGGQSINGVVLSDPLLQGANGTLSAAVESGAADGILSVGETFTYTGTYTAQQSDIDDNGGGDGDIDNTATVISTEIPEPQSDTAAVPIVQLLSYAITKTVTDVDGGGAGGAVDAAGDVIMYSIVVTNTGGQSINGVVLSDPLLQGANGTLSAAVESGAADGILSVGETFTYTGTYTAQQSDIDDNGGGDGDIDNTATVISTEIPEPQSDTAAVPIVQLLSYAITKTVTDVDGGGAGGAVDAAGDVIMYSIVVTNTGGQSINGVVLSDPLLQGANGTLSAAVESGAADGILSVGETFTYTGTYTAQQSDIDDNGGGDGDIDNTATVISTEIPEPQSDTAAVPIVQQPNNSISGFVYVDTNNNGIREPLELGLPNVPITISGPVTQTVFSGPGGGYSFVNLPSGIYNIAEAQPSMFVDGIDTRGTPALGSVINDNFINLGLSGNVTAVNYNFGERGLDAPFVSKTLLLASTPPASQLVSRFVVAPGTGNLVPIVAAGDGVMQVAAEAENVRLELYTSSMLPVAIATSAQTLQADVEAGKTYLLALAEGEADTFVNIRQLIWGETPVRTNPDNPLDVNVDGRVSASDALVVINNLISSLGGTSPGPSLYYMDVNRDDGVTALDALAVINRLGKSEVGSAVPSGEQSPLPADRHYIGITDANLTVRQGADVADAPLASHTIKKAIGGFEASASDYAGGGDEHEGSDATTTVEDMENQAGLNEVIETLAADVNSVRNSRL